MHRAAAVPLDQCHPKLAVQWLRKAFHVCDTPIAPSNTLQVILHGAENRAKMRPREAVEFLRELWYFRPNAGRRTPYHKLRIDESRDCKLRKSGSGTCQI